MNAELSRKIDELERRLDSGECSEGLQKGLTEKHGNPPTSLIERYRSILKWDNITAMGEPYRSGGYSYIDDKFKPLLDGVKYRNADNPSAPSLSRTELASITSSSSFALSESISAANSRAAVFAAFPENSVGYSMPPGFMKFYEYPGENRPFFDELTAMVNQPDFDPIKLYDGQENKGGSNSEGKQRNMISSLLELVESAYTGLTNEPLGAKNINDAETPAPERLGILDIAKLLASAYVDPVSGVVDDPAGSLARAGDYLLLLTYDASAFSNYSTTKPGSIGKTRDELSGIDFLDSVTGVPISPRVNYFYQSEWEYLYHGSQNADENLRAVTKLLFIVRLICNYITVFSVSEVSLVVAGIEAAFAWCPPLGVVLGELARAAFVAAETLVDVASLRSGHKVPFLKSAVAGEWVCSPSGVVEAVGSAATSELSGDGEESGKNEKGLSYSNYLLLFFVAKSLFYSGMQKDAAAELALRTGDLIEWNVINYKGNVNADESKMAEALTDSGRFRLSDMNTDFMISTTANLRMLFLSMPFARNGVNGVLPPSSLPISVTDYRGY
jgi:hypothetical protein